jgi:hypothetical protein
LFALKGKPNIAQGNALETSEKKSDRNPVRVAPSSDEWLFGNPFRVETSIRIQTQGVTLG